MTVTSYDCLVTVLWLSHDGLMTVSWLSCDCLMTVSWLLIFAWTSKKTWRLFWRNLTSRRGIINDFISYNSLWLIIVQYFFLSSHWRLSNDSLSDSLMTKRYVIRLYLNSFGVLETKQPTKPLWCGIQINNYPTIHPHVLGEAIHGLGKLLE